MPTYVWTEMVKDPQGRLVRLYATNNAAQVAVYRLRRDPRNLDGVDGSGPLGLSFHIQELDPPIRGNRWGVFTGVKVPEVQDVPATVPDGE